MSCKRLASVSSEKHDLPARWRFDELRLLRLNLIVRLPPPYSLADLIRGCYLDNNGYGNFRDKKFKWLLAVFVNVTVVFSSLQAALATMVCQESPTVTRASRVLNLVSIGAVGLILGVIMGILIFAIPFKAPFAWKNERNWQKEKGMHQKTLDTKM